MNENRFSHSRNRDPRVRFSRIIRTRNSPGFLAYRPFTNMDGSYGYFNSRRYRPTSGTFNPSDQTRRRIDYQVKLGNDKNFHTVILQAPAWMLWGVLILVTCAVALQAILIW